MGATSDSGFRDAVHVAVNPDDGDGAPRGDALPQLSRPADSAPAADWVDYCVALGADRGFIEGGVRYYDPDQDPSPGDPDAEHYVQSVGLSRAELIDFADRLGG